jgi:FkbM family methyltransferase
MSRPPWKPALPERVRMSQAAISDWPRFLAFGAVNNVFESTWVPSRLAWAVSAHPVSVRPRGQARISATIGDLGSIYDVFVVEDYAMPTISWSEVKTVIDCGANIGAFSLWALSRAPCQVLAVEPSPTTFATLRSNLERFEVRASVLKAAIGVTRGKTLLYDTTASTYATTTPAAQTSRARSYAVEQVTLADVIATSGFAHVDLLKMDIEGAERDVLADVDPGVLERVETIVVECHPHAGSDAETVSRSLRRCGMEVVIDPYDRMLVGHRS